MTKKSIALRAHMIADDIDRHPGDRTLATLYRKSAENSISRFGQPYTSEDVARAVHKPARHTFG